MHLTDIDLLLWAAGLCVHIAILCVLWIRHRARTFPIFTALVTANVVRTCALYLIVANHGSKHTYLVTYLSLGVLDLLLQLGVVYEIASHTFRPLGKWASDVHKSLLWLITVSVTVAIGLTCLSEAPPARNVLQADLIRGNLLSAALMSELFVGMTVLSLTVRLPWKTHVARIAQGLGFYSLTCILIATGHSYLGMDHNAGLSSALSYCRILTYLACAGYWTVMLWRDAPAPKVLPEEMRTKLFSLQRRVEYDLLKLRTWRRG